MELRWYSVKTNFDEIVAGTDILALVEVCKPGSQEWFRVHPDEKYRFQTVVLSLKSDNHYYLVDPVLHAELADDIQPVILFMAITTQERLFIWPVRLPKDGVADKFIQTDLVAARTAETQWTRRYWVPTLKMHRIRAWESLENKPRWPERTFEEIIKIAFKDRYIRTLEHPIVKALRGDN